MSHSIYQSIPESAYQSAVSLTETLTETLTVSGSVSGSESLNHIFSELQSIYTNPESYTKIPEVDLSSSDSIQRKMINLIQPNIDNIDNIDKIDNTIISKMARIIREFFSTLDINVNIGELGEYLRYYNMLSQTPCECFVDNSDICNDYTDNDKIPVEILFKGMSCKTCGILKDSHKVCSKYNANNDSPYFYDSCEKCGMDASTHTVCDIFCHDDCDGSDDCVNCGRNIKSHQQKEISLGKYPCKNFISSTNNDCYDCKFCIHSKMNHMINPRLFEMNKEANDKFTDLAFAYQVDFNSLNCREAPVLQSQFIEYLRMYYSQNHPQYSYFCENKSENKSEKCSITLV